MKIAVTGKYRHNTNELVEYTKWSKWDGKLPTTMTGEGAMIQIPASTENENK